MNNRFAWLIYLAFFLLLPFKGPASVSSEKLSLFAEDQWQQIFSKDGISVFSQEIPDSEILAFKATGIINAPVEQVMEVLRRVELSQEWMPDIQAKYTVKELSDFEAVTYSLTKLPWPFSGRELLLHNKLRLDRQKKFLVVDTSSVHDTPYPIGQGNVRAFMQIGQTCIRPAGEYRTEIFFAFLLDPRGYIPAWIVNIKQKKLPYDFLKNLEKIAGNTRFELRPAFRAYLDELKAILEEPVGIPISSRKTGPSQAR